jgi:hypothetical protein
MGAKAEIGWKTIGEDGVKRHVYAQHVGSDWKFYERPRRRGRDIEWVPLVDPSIQDWLELLDCVERGYVRRRFMPDDIESIRTKILERFPEHRFE